ncbi:MAG: family 1 glycosylhydrolase [Anaerolineales bacterium]
MIRAKFTFPKGFLWGTATSSHQVEGDNRNNDWWRWEESGRVVQGQVSGRACEWWAGRWAEDFDRARQGGQTAHRLSLEWSRIEPGPAVWDESAIDAYRTILHGALDRGLMPFVSLHHFTTPQWLADHGGWASPSIVGHFARFARKVARSFQGLVGAWVTINEPNVLAVMAYLRGEFPPGERSLRATVGVLENLMLAHAAAYRELKAVDPASLVGSAHHYRGMIPFRPRRPLDRWAARIRHRLFNDLIPGALHDGWFRFPGRTHRLDVRGTQDFLGLNYYTEELVAFDLSKPKELFGRGLFGPDADVSGSGFLANVPGGLWAALRWAHRFQLPIYILENGVDDAADRIRPRYLALHLREVWRAANFNWKVRGYFHWSIVDNFEWSQGWQQQFGLWELDPSTQRRRKRPSADLYADICQNHAISSEAVARYAPDVLERMYPGGHPVDLVIQRGVARP